MLRKSLCLVMIVCAGGLAMGQSKNGKDKDGKKPGVKATVAKVDVDKKVLGVTLDGGKKLDINVTKDVKFFGPKGGKREKGIRDEVLKPGVVVRLVFDTAGKAVKEVHLPTKTGKKGKAPDKK